MKTRLLIAAVVSTNVFGFGASAQSGAPGSTGTGVTANVSPQTHCIDPTTGAPRLRTGSGATFFSPNDMGNTGRSLSSGPTSGGAGMTVTTAGAPGSAGVGTVTTGSGPPGVAGVAPLTGPGTTGSALPPSSGSASNSGSAFTGVSAIGPAQTGVQGQTNTAPRGSAGVGTIPSVPAVPDTAGASAPSRTPESTMAAAGLNPC